MMYLYSGNERLQLWFFSPNICAAFLVMAVLLSIGLFLLAVYQKGRFYKAISVILGIAVFIQLLMLAVTYSRGGYIACLTGLILGYMIAGKRWCLFFGILFILILLAIGDGPARIKSIGNISDGSIYNRLLLWKGGAGIIAKHWDTGVGALPTAGKYYTTWYQPLWLDEVYYSLINDYLTIAATYGVFVLMLLLIGFGGLFQQGYRIWRQNHNLMLLYSMCAVLGYMICAFFSTCYRFGSLIWLLEVAVLIISGFIIYGNIKYQLKWNYYDFWGVPVAAITVCLVIIGYGMIVNAEIPYTVHYDAIEMGAGEIPMVELQPKSSSKGTILILTSSIQQEIRPWLRTAAEQGYIAKAVETDYGLTGLQNSKKIMPNIILDSPSYLLGYDREKALLVVAVAADLPDITWAGIIVSDIPAEWPFCELFPLRKIVKLKVPVIMVQSSNFAKDGEILLKLCQENNIPAFLGICANEERAERIWRFLQAKENGEMINWNSTRETDISLPVKQ